LGRRHAAYGVKDEHYGTVGAALLWTLGEGLGADFTPEVKDAWTSVYGTLATTMREAARESNGPNVPPSQSRNAVVPEAEQAALSTAGHMHTIIGVFVLGLGAATGLGFAAAADMGKEITATIAQAHQPPIVAGARTGTNYSRFLLNALLVTALDTDALPLRWVDPRGPSQCARHTTVLVNGAPLVAGALVPNQPFELEWRAVACLPFGKAGPRYDGRIKLTVYREDWGFSATVDPRHFRITSLDNGVTWIRPGAVSLPPYGDADSPMILTASCAQERLPCL
jgi:hypothetical protein